MNTEGTAIGPAAVPSSGFGAKTAWNGRAIGTPGIGAEECPGVIVVAGKGVGAENGGGADDDADITVGIGAEALKGTGAAKADGGTGVPAGETLGDTPKPSVNAGSYTALGGAESADGGASSGKCKAGREALCSDCELAFCIGCGTGL
ncbi:MAG: hypothetical protein FWG00_02420 [Coriobacteriia bacterium]|nr:hypothetical protein [Coriobacteriia bacterium]